MAIHVDVARKSMIGTDGSLTDGGSLAVVSSINSVLALSPSNPNVITMIKNALDASFNKVTSQGEATTYEWRWCPGVGAFKFVCSVNDVLDVDVDGPDPVVVHVVVGDEYPAP
jgi:hypothetical protein